MLLPLLPFLLPLLLSLFYPYSSLPQPYSSLSYPYPYSSLSYPYSFFSYPILLFFPLLLLPPILSPNPYSFFHIYSCSPETELTSDDRFFSMGSVEEQYRQVFDIGKGQHIPVTGNTYYLCTI